MVVALVVAVVVTMVMRAMWAMWLRWRRLVTVPMAVLDVNRHSSNIN